MSRFKAGDVVQFTPPRWVWSAAVTTTFGIGIGVGWGARFEIGLNVGPFVLAVTRFPADRARVVKAKDTTSITVDPAGAP